MLSLDNFIDEINELKSQAERSEFLEMKIAALGREMESLIDVLVGLKRGECWCEVAVGNPMMKGKHSLYCARATILLKEFGIEKTLSEEG